MRLRALGLIGWLGVVGCSSEETATPGEVAGTAGGTASSGAGQGGSGAAGQAGAVSGGQAGQAGAGGSGTSGQGGQGGGLSGSSGQGGVAGEGGVAGQGGEAGAAGEAGTAGLAGQGGGVGAGAGGGGAGGGGASGQGGSGAGDVKQICAAVESRRCQVLAGCGCASPEALAECEQERGKECEARFAAAVEPLAQGTIVIQPEREASCLAFLEQQSAACAAIDWSALLARPDCGQIFVDTAAVGAKCHSVGGAAACAGGGGFCLTYLGETPTCTVRGKLNEECPLGVCAEGLTCVNNTCVPPLAAGASCPSPSSCAAGLVCGPDGTCATPGSASDPCSLPAQCGPALTCSLAGTCIDATPLDATCLSSDECGAGRTCLGAGAARACEAQAGKGAPCADWPGSCAPGLLCIATDETTLVCLAPAAQGEACTGGLHCAAGLACDFAATPPRCQKAPAAGQACKFEGPVMCGPGLGCDQDTCKPLPVQGKPCFNFEPACAAGLGCDDQGVCQAPPGKGKPCLTGPGERCAAGLVCNNVQNLCTEPLAAGQECMTPSDCGPGLECGLLKDPSRLTCYPVPTAAGAPCEQGCGAGLFCRQTATQGVCKPGACASL